MPKIKNKAKSTSGTFYTKPKTLQFPVFSPDATYSTISHVPLYIVKNKLKGVVITTLHATAHGLDILLEKTGQNFNQFANLPEDIITLSDSGGFQILSLIHNKKLGKITKQGAKFKYPKDGRQIWLTPETSQQIQHKLGTHIRVVLDYPIMGHEDKKTIQKSVQTTISWAKRAKKEFLKLHNLKNADFLKTQPTWDILKNQITFSRPLLTGVVQGGNDKKAREECAKELRHIGFDIYGFGGWPMTPEGELNKKILEHFLKIIPANSVAYAMGLGTPDDIYTLSYMGYHLFDCTIPTRNARHGSLFVTKGYGEPKGKHYDLLHIKTARYEYDNKPIDPTCDCPVCQNYTRSYIRFLFKSKNPVASTLASIHNIWWYSNFMDKLRSKILADNAGSNTNDTHNASIADINDSANITKSANNSAPTPAQNSLLNDTLYIYHDATCKVKNAHIKGHSGKGESHCGFYIKDSKGNILTQQTQKLSDNITIPEAEFRCFLLALQFAYDLIQNCKIETDSKNTATTDLGNITKLITNTDSQLLAYWINGKYRIKKPHIKELYEKYLQIKQAFENLGITIQIKWHARENESARLADELANR